MEYGTCVGIVSRDQTLDRKLESGKMPFCRLRIVRCNQMKLQNAPDVT